jgi:hypothetical protein
VAANDRRHHLDEQWMVADSWGALESDSRFARELFSNTNCVT